MITNEMKRNPMDWTPLNSHIISTRFYSWLGKVTIIQIYVPTNESVDEEKEQFYEQLQATNDKCNKTNIIILMGDLNVKVRNHGQTRHQQHQQQWRRPLWIEYDYWANISGACFPHLEIHKTTWFHQMGKCKTK